MNPLVLHPSRSSFCKTNGVGERKVEHDRHKFSFLVDRQNKPPKENEHDDHDFPFFLFLWCKSE